ncbi:hypothetical protein NDU88_001255 [Pleurodeles waltl]|uniref:Uncharacterized protein n=1 Tax=Pleurodeles waltl TaxID=8319 RepID=A0AAV7VYG0_PLEWA|nr:hypothetical protein NDU88_001255 [Pleurodeles waltl]
MIARFFNFKDRDNILKEERRSEDLQWENHRILIFPDYTREVQTRRRSYEQVKQKLRAMQLSYMLLFPVRLKVIMADRAHFFESPEEAWDWLTKEGIEARRGPLKQGGEPPRDRPPPMGGPRRSRRRTISRKGKRGDLAVPIGGGTAGDPGSQMEGTAVESLEVQDQVWAEDGSRLSQSPVLG